MKRKLTLLLSLLTISTISISLNAANKWWDINGATSSGNGTSTANGTWDTGGTANWTIDSTGIGGGTTWSANDTAFFSAGTDANGSFTVTIPTGTIVTAAGVTVEEGTILLGPGTLNFGTVNGIFDIASGATMNISGTGSGTVTNTGGISKTGLGILLLGGTEKFTNSTALSPFLTINSGTVDFSADGGLGLVPSTANSNAVLINGGTLRYSGTGATTLDVKRGVTIGASGGTIEVIGSTATLSLPSAATFTLNGGPSALTTKTGAGRFTMNTTANTYSGKYKVLAGSLNVPGDGRLGTVPASVQADYITLDGASAAFRVALTTTFALDAKRGITLGAGGGSLAQPGPGVMTYNGIIAGTSGGALRIDSNDSVGGGTTAGVIILGGANTYNGPTTINTGVTLKLGAAGAIPDTSVVTPLGSGAVFDLNGFDETIKSVSGSAGTIAVGAKTLTLANPAGETYSSVFSGSGAGMIVKNGAGTLTLSGSSTGFTGEFDLNSGTVAIGGANCFGGTGGTGKLRINGGKIAANNASGRAMVIPLDIGGSFTCDQSVFGPTSGQISFNSGAITLKVANPTVTVDPAGYVLPFSAVIGDEGAGRGFTKAGAGQLTMNNENTFGGNFTLNAGVVSINGSTTNNFGNGVGNLILAGGKILITADRGTSGSAIKNPLVLTGDSEFQSTGTTGTRNLTFGGAWTTTAGSLTIHEAGTQVTNGVFNVRFTNAFSFSQPITFVVDTAPRSANLDIWNRADLGEQTYSGLISGPGTIKRSATTASTGGKVTFTQANTYSGGTALNDGEISLGSDCTGPADAPTAGPVGTGTITVSNDYGSVSASGVARNLKNHFTFATAGRRLTFLGSNDLELSGNMDLGGLAVAFTNNNSGLCTISGTISNGTVDKEGPGTLTFTGPNTYAGGTFIGSGIMDVQSSGGLGSGNVTNGATLKLGSNTAMSPTANLILTAAGAPVVNILGGVTATVRRLSFDGGVTFQMGGTWGATGSGATHIDDVHFSGAGQLDVSAGSTVTTLSASPNPSTFGQEVTLTATVTGVSPTGTVVFKDGINSLGSAPVGTPLVTSSIQAGSRSLTAQYTGDSNNDASTSEIVTQVVDKADQTNTFNAISDKTYGSSFNPGATASSGLDVTYTVISGPATVSGSLVTVTNLGSITIRASQAGDVNYNAAADVEQTLNGIPAPLTVTANSLSRSYGSTNPAFTVSYTGFQLGETKNTSDVTGDPDVGTVADTNSAPAIYAITNGVGSLASTHYNLTFVDGSLTVTQSLLTVTADSFSRLYGATNPTLSVSYNGFVNGQDLGTSDVAGAPDFGLAAPVDATSPIGVYGITNSLGSLTSTNYSFTNVSGSLTVTPAPLTVTADGASKVYGASDPTLTAQLTSGALINGDTLSGALTRVAGESVGTYAIQQGTLTAGTNYDLTFVSADLTIGVRAITVTADAKSKAYGDVDPLLTYQITSGSLQSGDSISGTLTRVTGEGIGAYGIQQGTLTAGTNYNLSFVAADLSVTPRLLTVTADSFSRVYGGTNPTLTVSYSGFAAGESMTNSDVAGEPAFGLSGVVDATSPVGVYPITNSLGSLTSTNYSFANVNGAFTVTPAALTVTADAKSKVYGESDPTLTVQVTSGTLINGDNLSGALTRAVGTNVGDYAIEQGTLTAGTNYNLTFVSANLSITSRPITVAADAKSKVYGESDLTLTAQVTSGSLVTGDSLSGSLSRVAGENIGSYAVQQGSLTAGTNYNLTFVSADVTITAAPITVTADAKNKVYGDSDPILTSQITSGALVGSDSLSGALTRVLGEAVGTYAIQQGTLTAGTNYNLTFVSSNLTVSTRPITVTADAKSKAYGDVDPALTAQITSGSLVTGDSLSGELARATGESLGAYAINQGALSAGTNYNFTFVAADLTITTRPITVTADGKNKAYGDPDPALTYQITSGSLVSGDSLSGSLSRVSGEEQGSYAIQQGSLSATTNYALTFVSANLTIGGQAITVTADSKAKAYGDSDPELTYQITSGSLQPGDSLSGSLTRVSGEGVGTYAIQQGTLTAGTNYTLTFVSSNLTISARLLTVTADSLSRVYGETNPPLTVNYSGFASGESITNSDVAGAPAFDLNEVVDVASPIGIYSITNSVGTLTSTNYSFNMVNGTLTVTPAPLTVTANATNKVYGFADPSLTAQVTGGALMNGDALSGVVARENGENIGSYAIQQGTLSAGTNYNLNFVSANLTITTRPITVAADAKNKTYGDTDPTLTTQVTSGSLASGDELSGALSRVSGETIGTYAIEQSTLTAGTNYNLTFAPADLTISARPITLSADPKNKVYGSADPELTSQITSGSLVSGDSFSGALSRVVGEGAGVYAIEQNTLSAGTNYNLTFVPEALTITPRSLTATADNKTRLAGATNPVFTVTYTGFANSETLATSDLAGSPSLATAATQSSPAGSYVITNSAGSLTSTNYNISFFNGTLTVQPLVNAPYYSQGNLAPNNLANWNSDRSGAGIAPANFTGGDTFVIQNLHSMTNASAAWAVTGTGNKVQVESGGTLTAATNISCTTFQVDNGGTFIFDYISTVSALNGSANDIPGSGAAGRVFGPSSTVEIRQWGNGVQAPSNVLPAGVTWGNLVINIAVPMGGSWQMSGAVTNIAGNFAVKSLGTTTQREFRFNANTPTTLTVNIGGNVQVSGGVLNLVSGTSILTLNVGGTIQVTGGLVQSTGSGVPIVTVNGNEGKISVTGGGTNLMSGSYANAPASPVTNSITLDNGTFGVSGVDFTLSTNRGITLSAAGGNIYQASSRTLTIPGNITGPGGLTKTYPAGATTVNLTLSGTNDFAGDFTITGGGVRFNSDFAAGKGKVIVSPPGGTFTASTTLRNLGVAISTLTNDVVFNANNGTQITLDSEVANTFVMSGNFSGVGTVKQGVNTGGTVVLSGDNSAWSGGMISQRGTLRLSHKNALGTGVYTIAPITNVPAAMAVSLQAGIPLTGANAVTNAVQIATTNIVGSTSHWFTISGNNDLELSGPISLGVAGSSSPTFTNNNTGATIFSGVISGTGFGLTTFGSGTLTLSGANTYDGGTVIGSGVLKVSNFSGSATGNGNVSINSTALLTGTGSISGAVTLSGIVSPADSVGTLSTGSETWNGGGRYKWEINDATGTAGVGYDKITITGGLTINADSGNKFTIDISSLAGGVAGEAANFTNTVSQNWTLLSTTTGIIGFNSNAFALNTNGFANNIGTGSFSITTNATDLLLTFTAPVVVSAPTNFVTTTAGQGTFSGTANTTYTIQYTESLSPVNWQTLNTATTDGAGLGTFADPASLQAQRFYRVVYP